MKTEQAAFVCSHVFSHTRPVRLVTREGGEWQFLCGEEHPEHEIPHVVGLNHILEFDPSLEEILDLPNECEAERAAQGSVWIRTSISPTT